MAKEDTFITSLQLMSAREMTDDFIFEKVGLTEEQAKEYHKLRRMEDLISDALEEGWDKFDWMKTHKAGHLCENDYDIFEELKDLKAEDWDK